MDELHGEITNAQALRPSGQEKPSIYERAITAWGENLQLDMVVEECSELIRAIMKYKRKLATGGLYLEARESMAEEVADVSIMIEQLKFMRLNDIAHPFKDDIKRWMEYKLDRLEYRLTINERENPER
jgi:NTP pyrophosphatase (non-canonical NTP hydrolase)